MSNDSRPKRMRPLPRTPVALSVLNLLNERPMHPYEMRTPDAASGVTTGPSSSGNRRSTTSVTRLAERGLHRAGRREQGGPGGRSAPCTPSPRPAATNCWSGCGSWPATPPEAPCVRRAADVRLLDGPGAHVAAFQQRAARLEADISSSDAYRRAFVADMPGFVTDLRHRGGVHPGDAQSRARLAARHAGRAADGTFPWPTLEQLEEGGFMS